MFMQSAAMALGFGSFFQYGKRKISSMSNDEFNILTPEALTSQLLSNVNNMIPSVESSFKQMEHMNVIILDSMAKYLGQGITFLNDLITGKRTVSTPGGTTFDVGNFPSNFQESFAGIGDYLNQLNLDTGQKAEASLPEFVPETSTTVTFNAIENYALRFMQRTSGGGFKTTSRKPTLREINYLLTQKAKGNMPNIPSSILSALSKFEKDKRPKPKTTTQAIADSGATGQNAKIASLYARAESLLFQTRRAIGKSRRDKVNDLRKKVRLALEAMKIYNRYVQSIGKAGLTVDTKLSLGFRKMTPKK